MAAAAAQVQMAASLTKVAAEQQWQFDATTLARARKERGHFGTRRPLPISSPPCFTRIPQKQMLHVG